MPMTANKTPAAPTPKSSKDISKRPKVPKGVGPWLLPEGVREGRWEWLEDMRAIVANRSL
jgi:hypothetical protein